MAKPSKVPSWTDGAGKSCARLRLDANQEYAENSHLRRASRREEAQYDVRRAAFMTAKVASMLATSQRKIHHCPPLFGFFTSFHVVASCRIVVVTTPRNFNTCFDSLGRFRATPEKLAHMFKSLVRASNLVKIVKICKCQTPCSVFRDTPENSHTCQTPLSVRRNCNDGKNKSLWCLSLSASLGLVVRTWMTWKNSMGTTHETTDT